MKMDEQRRDAGTPTTRRYPQTPGRKEGEGEDGGGGPRTSGGKTVARSPIKRAAMRTGRRRKEKKKRDQGDTGPPECSQQAEAEQTQRNAAQWWRGRQPATPHHGRARSTRGSASRAEQRPAAHTARALIGGGAARCRVSGRRPHEPANRQRPCPLVTIHALPSSAADPID